MKRRDRKNAWDKTVLVVLPAVGAVVTVTGRGRGEVIDRGFGTVDVRLAGGETVRVGAGELEGV